jgi:hypothetical protein
MCREGVWRGADLVVEKMSENETKKEDLKEEHYQEHYTRKKETKIRQNTNNSGN